jgi:hypothetical protein
VCLLTTPLDIRQFVDQKAKPVELSYRNGIGKLKARVSIVENS